MSRNSHRAMVGLSAMAITVASSVSLAAGSEPDNSRMNKVENLGQTAQQQPTNRSDEDVIRLIRRSLIKDKSLSVYAHNVKILADSGSVTLKGPVRTDAERNLVEAKAASVVGADHVSNQMTVAAH